MSHISMVLCIQFSKNFKPKLSFKTRIIFPWNGFWCFLRNPTAKPSEIFDVTVKPLCKSNQIQRIMYNTLKRIHLNKFQSIAAPITNLSDLWAGKNYDGRMLANFFHQPYNFRAFMI